VEYTKSNISGFGSSINHSLLPQESFTADKWIWGYKYNYAGQREQKRLLKSPHKYVVISMIKANAILIIK